MNIVQACFISGGWCEYCSNTPQKVYLPFTTSTLNPAYICEDCAKEHTIVDWFDSDKDYTIALNNLKKNNLT